MTRILGKVKWFNGYNQRTGRQNHFGFLVSRSGYDVYIHKNDVVSVTSKIYEGIWVTYEETIGRNGRKANNVRVLADEEKDTVLCLVCDSLGPDDKREIVAQLIQFFAETDQLPLIADLL